MCESAKNCIITSDEQQTNALVDCKLAQKFSILKRQFLSYYPVHLIKWEEILSNITWDEQVNLLQHTVLCELNAKMPLKRAYQLTFMKTIINELEKFNVEIHDAIYETFCTLQNPMLSSSSDQTAEAEHFTYKHYIIPVTENHNVTISLKESTNFVMDGTTGLCSWQASKALSEFLLQNSENFENKSVLELGSGTGLCSFIASKCCNLRQIVLSDGSLKVINLLHENLKRNFNNVELKFESQDFKIFNAIETGRVKKDNSIGIWHLPWENIKEYEEIMKIVSPEIILAADIIYDDDILPILSQTIDYLFTKANNTCVMYLAATIRNETTLGNFLKLLDCLRFSYQKQPPICNNKLFWDNRTTIDIYFITRNDK